MEEYPSGASVIAIPEFPLPQGWSKERTTVLFVAPVGYPLAQPDCFWADEDLRLSSGAVPQNSGTNPIPERGGSNLWFSWHLSGWSPNQSNLLTYINSIKARFKAVQ